MSVGISLPFLPGYYASLGLSGAQVGVLLAVSPLFALLSPPLWGQLADRTGRHGLVLAVLCVGGAAGYGLLAGAREFGAVVLALAFQATFGAAITTIIDSIALHHVAQTGQSFASIRTWGSVGFVVSTLLFGAMVTGFDRTVVLVPLALLLAAGAWAALRLRVRVEHHEGPRPDFSSALQLLKKPGVALFLTASASHWVACAPYHGSLTLHITALRLPPLVVSVSSALAVTSEVVVMATWSRWSGRLRPPQLLLASFGVSALRWAVIASTSNPVVLVATAALHGLTFGAFYLASVSYMSERAPGRLRATGQALFVAATFGVGGLIGFIGGGRAWDALGGHRLFALATALELPPMLAILLATRRAQLRGNSDE